MLSRNWVSGSLGPSTFDSTPRSFKILHDPARHRVVTEHEDRLLGRRLQRGPFPGADDVGDEQTDRDGDEGIQHQQADQAARHATLDLRGHQDANDGEQDQRRREGPQQSQDQSTGRGQEAGPLTEHDPGQRPEHQCEDDPDVERGAVPACQETWSRPSGLVIEVRGRFASSALSTWSWSLGWFARPLHGPRVRLRSATRSAPGTAPGPPSASPLLPSKAGGGRQPPTDYFSQKRTIGSHVSIYKVLE